MLSRKHKQVVESEINNMPEAGEILLSTTTWTLPVVIETEKGENKILRRQSALQSKNGVSSWPLRKSKKFLIALSAKPVMDAVAHSPQIYSSLNAKNVLFASILVI